MAGSSCRLETDHRQSMASGRGARYLAESVRVCLVKMELEPERDLALGECAVECFTQWHWELERARIARVHVELVIAGSRIQHKRIKGSVDRLVQNSASVPKTLHTAVICAPMDRSEKCIKWSQTCSGCCTVGSGTQRHPFG